jgi:hypothetical protein
MSSSTVKSRPNHYEILGLTPGASSDEIAQAFARELSAIRLSPFGSLTEVTIAYETLRDRTKREAYDISLGLKKKPPTPSIKAPTEWAPFAMRAAPRPAPRPAMNPLPRPTPKADALPRSKPVDEPKISPFAAAASPSEPSNADFHKARPRPSAPAEQPRRPEATAKPRFELPTGGEMLQFDEARRFRIDTTDLSQWKIPALAVGALILAVGLGAWTGLEAGNDNDQAQTENAVTLKVPAAKPLPELAGSPLNPPSSMAEAQPQRPTRTVAARVERARPPLQIDLPEEIPGEATQSAPAEIATEQAVAESPSVEATRAKLPLPNAVIARTIRRIGYPCGQVSGATAMGEPGVFKVTCTSGHSYRAAPVRGRYRFRQLGRS